MRTLNQCFAYTSTDAGVHGLGGSATPYDRLSAN